jgi:hypothetical protein
VTVRQIPLVTAAYGTRVARPARTTTFGRGGDGSQLGQRVRPVLGDHCLVGKSPLGHRGSSFCRNLNCPRGVLVRGIRGVVRPLSKVACQSAVPAHPSFRRPSAGLTLSGASRASDAVHRKMLHRFCRASVTVAVLLARPFCTALAGLAAALGLVSERTIGMLYLPA